MSREKICPVCFGETEISDLLNGGCMECPHCDGEGTINSVDYKYELERFIFIVGQYLCDMESKATMSILKNGYQYAQDLISKIDKGDKDGE